MVVEHGSIRSVVVVVSLTRDKERRQDSAEAVEGDDEGIVARGKPKAGDFRACCCCCY
jgi:hypothetical protein